MQNDAVGDGGFAYHYHDEIFWLDLISPLHIDIQSFQRIGAMDLGVVCAREPHECQNIVPSRIHHLGQLWGISLAIDR